MSQGLWRTCAVRVVCLLAAVSVLTVLPTSGPRPAGASHGENVVLQWNDAALAGVRATTLAPPVVARALAMVHTCIYDAWAAYDGRSVGTRLGASFRRPADERTPANVDQAISFAAYRAAVSVLPASKATLFDPLMASRGYDPADTSLDPSTPSGVGNLACKAVLDYRHADGANQLGDVAGGTSSVFYSDYTGYQSVNLPMDMAQPFNPATVRDPNKWQPLRFTNAAGAVVTPSWITPFWNKVKPFALRSSSMFRSSTGPAKFGTRAYLQQALEVLDMSANLTDRKKVIVEYWADGPRSETPPGHWNVLAQFVSHRDQHGVADDAKMFFALNNAGLDASIVAWDNKIAFDSARPITAIRHLFNGQPVSAWGGPGQGTKVIDGGQWLPFQPSTFPTPPFGEYTSGHSTFSAAAARVLELYTGSSSFGASVTMQPGSSRVEPGASPSEPVTLSWATFKDAADEAGLSRRLGGIHFAQADLDARANGKRVGDLVFGKAWVLFNGRSYPY